jgi:hypothetical protein
MTPALNEAIATAVADAEGLRPRPVLNLAPRGVEIIPMDRLDWFAANAPQTIPHWFDDGEAQAPDKPISADAALRANPEWQAFAEQERNECLQYLDSDFFVELPARYRDLCAAAWAAAAASDESFVRAQNEREARRYFAWVWHYAKTMALTKPAA